jgi:hypothetical protein
MIALRLGQAREKAGVHAGQYTVVVVRKRRSTARSEGDLSLAAQSDLLTDYRLDSL